jgi:hypothetical protein
MKRSTPASLKRVTPENLARLGAGRLAEILAEVAGSRADLKRRLRMELAAEQGAEHLLAEIDRRLARLAATHGAVSWRQRPAFVRDLDGLRGLIAGRLAELDLPAAQDRIVAFLALARTAQRRLRDKEGALGRVFEQAAADAAALLGPLGAEETGARLAALIPQAPGEWAMWLPGALAAGPQGLAAAILRYLAPGATPAWTSIVRRLADAAGDAELYRSTFTAEAQRTPQVAAEIAGRFLAAGQLEPARRLLEGAVQPGLFRRSRGGAPEPDFDWESVWIDYLEQSGRTDEAQAARWASFERTLAVERARAFTARLSDFEDVEAEHRIFELVQAHPDAARALELLMGWPALPEAAQLIERRAGELALPPERAEAWAGKLRRRYPAAAHALLRRAAAEAFRRREFATCDRLTQEAEAIAL